MGRLGTVPGGSETPSGTPLPGADRASCTVQLTRTLATCVHMKSRLVKAAQSLIYGQRAHGDPHSPAQ